MHKTVEMRFHKIRKIFEIGKIREITDLYCFCIMHSGFQKNVKCFRRCNQRYEYFRCQIEFIAM